MRKVDKAFADAVAVFGKVDILSNNAGICIPMEMQCIKRKRRIHNETKIF